MSYSLIDANLLYQSTLSFRCIGPTEENHRCDQDITRAAMEKVELALRVYLRPGVPLTRFGIERLAKSYICEMHPHRTDVVDMVTSQWYADLLGIPRKRGEIEKLKRENAALEKTSNDLAVVETLLRARLAATERMNEKLSDIVKQLQDESKARLDIMSQIEAILA
ncbi:unnamed protein product [Aureobasidium pullulans]|nr:unnamed protein product [Aureobasidium pullulans]